MGKLKNYDHMKNNSYGKKVNDEEVLKLYEQGKTDTEIGKLLKVSNVAIFYWRKVRNLARNRIKKIPTPKPKKAYKRLSKLTYIEEQVLLGTAIADGSIQISYKGDRGRLSFAHSLKQENYALAKGKILKKLDFNVLYKENPDKRNGRTYRCVQLTSKNFMELKKLHDILYIDKDKQPTWEYFKKMDALAIAIAFMDDGSKHKNGYTFAFCSFTEKTNKLFIKRLKDFNIEATLWKSGVVYIPLKYKEVFKTLVKHFMHKDLMYKL